MPYWTQKNTSDTAGDLWESFGIDLSSNEGRLRAGRRIILNTGTDDVSQITSYPCAFNVCGSSAFALSGTSNVGFAFKNDGTMIGTFAKDLTVGFTTTAFGGSGLNDATYGGAETTTVAHTYVVQIDATGTPDTFKWKVDSGSFTTGVAVTGSAQTLANGVTITFAATTGHTLNASWTATTKVPPYTIDSKKSDAVFSNNALYVTCQNPASTGFVSFYKKVGNAAWTRSDTTETSDASYTNMLCTYAGRTYMTSTQSKMISWDSSDSIASSGQYTITLNVSGDFSRVIVKPLAADDRIFLLCLNTTGGKGIIGEWDGSANQLTYQHVLESSGALSGVMFEGVPYVMDVNGVLLKWNGGTFVEVARLNRKNNLPLYNPLSLVNDRFVHPNGMSVVQGRIQVMINNQNYDNAGTIEETIPSGIWEYDPNNQLRGLTHKEAVSFNKSGDTITNYGSTRIAGAGALREMGLQSTASGANGSVFIGATYYTDATTSKSGIFYDDRNDTLQKAALITTTKIQASDITDIIQMFYAKYKRFVNSADRFVFKYRTIDADPIEMTITWTSATTFTTTNSAMANYAVGDEVEVIQGIGAGKISHINALPAPVTGTYTVTVDETYTSASGTAKVRVNKWKKIYEVADITTNFIGKTLPTSNTYSWYQVRAWMLFTGKQELEIIKLQNLPAETSSSRTIKP